MTLLPSPRLWRRTLVPSEDAEDLYENAPCGYLSIQPDDSIARINQTLLDWTGHDRDDLVGSARFSDLLSGGSRLYFETHVRPTLVLGDRIQEIDLDLRCADGSTLPVLLNALVVRDDHGQIQSMRISVVDVTRRREYEDELRRARAAAEDSEARAQDLATTLQSALLPPLVPEIPGADIGVAYRAAGDGFQIGGDFYDVFETGDGEWVLALGDVCGKGAGAAPVTGLVRYSIQAASVRQRRPSRVLSDVNEVLLRGRTERFCTAACLRLRPRPEGGADLTFALAGHHQPLHLTADGVGAVGRHGVLLGVQAALTTHDTTMFLAPGEALVLFSDGMTEARSGSQFLGEEGLLALLTQNQQLDASDMATELARAAVDFQDGVPRDDIVVLVIRAPEECQEA